MKEKLVYLINDKEVKRSLFYDKLEEYVDMTHGVGDCYASYKYYDNLLKKYKRELLEGFKRGSKEIGLVFEIKRINQGE